MKSVNWVIKDLETPYLVTMASGRHYPFRWHHHDDYELFAPVRGTGHALVGDSMSEFVPGQVYFMAPALAHAFYTMPAAVPPPKGRKAYVLNLAPALLANPVFGQAAEILRQQAIRGVLYTGAAAAELVKAIVGLQTAQGLMALETLVHLLAVLERQTPRFLASPNWASPLDKKTSRRMDAVFTFLHTHYTADVRLASVAEVAHLGPVPFCRLFKRITNKTLVEYLNELRVGHACRLLLESELSITEVALASGYNTLSNFNRMFHRQKHISPRAWRQRASKMNGRKT